jgi:uncharacterized protein YggL (DUF469 family)
MSQLTFFEQYVESVFGLEDVTYISDEQALSNLGFMQVNHPDEYQEIIDQVNASYEPPEGKDNDLDELTDAITNRNPMKFVMELERLMIVEFKAYIDEVQQEIAYKQLNPERDGSYEAKQAREIAL